MSISERKVNRKYCIFNELKKECGNTKRGEEIMVCYRRQGPGTVSDSEDRNMCKCQSSEIYSQNLTTLSEFDLSDRLF